VSASPRVVQFRFPMLPIGGPERHGKVLNWQPYVKPESTKPAPPAVKQPHKRSGMVRRVFALWEAVSGLEMEEFAKEEGIE
jgi:hypothetical protein